MREAESKHDNNNTNGELAMWHVYDQYGELQGRTDSAILAIEGARAMNGYAVFVP